MKGQNERNTYYVRTSLRGCLMLLIMFSFILKLEAQHTSIRTNLLYWLTATPNAGVETRLSGHSTLGLSVSMNPFLFPEINKSDPPRNPKLLHWTVVPEYKYWFCRPYERWFVGAYGIYGDFNIGGISFLDFAGLADSRYEGAAYGGGVSLGYQWALGRRWGIEASLGAGYLRLDYKQYDCGACGTMRKQARRNYVGPTRAAVSVVYYIR
ncbi:MAG: DUF3575 domain-containing protein [Parabacteroides sp.]|nr:DUF3575 domain-containing protein [Parabacteroides sp.]